MSVFANPQYCGCDGFVPPGPQYPRSAPSGWWSGGFCSGCRSNPCCCQNNTGCPIQLDYNCIIYHKDGSQQNNLGPIGLNNGATLQLFAETIAPPVGMVMNVPNYTLPVLRAVPYTINTLQQFAQSVDTQFGVVATAIANAVAANVPVTPVNTNAIHLTATGPNSHTLTPSLIISATTNNQASILSDGLYVTPQNLNYNTSTHILSISSGNTVDLSSLVCGVGGFLGNVTADPSGPLDGQYWFRTDIGLATGLKIRLNGNTRTITTS